MRELQAETLTVVGIKILFGGISVVWGFMLKFSKMWAVVERRELERGAWRLQTCWNIWLISRDLMRRQIKPPARFLDFALKTMTVSVGNSFCKVVGHRVTISGCNFNRVLRLLAWTSYRTNSKIFGHYESFTPICVKTESTQWEPSLMETHRIKQNSDVLSCLICLCRPQPEEPVPLYEATVAMETVQRHQKTKAVVQLWPNYRQFGFNMNTECKGNSGV